MKGAGHCWVLSCDGDGRSPPVGYPAVCEWGLLSSVDRVDRLDVQGETTRAAKMMMVHLTIAFLLQLMKQLLLVSIL